MENTLEVVDLESIMEDELRCESLHGAGDDLDDGPACGSWCSVKVVARKHIDCDNDSFFICQNSYIWNLWYLEDSDPVYDNDCDGCGRPAYECWTITLI